jgi:hypothetical protein
LKKRSIPTLDELTAMLPDDERCMAYLEGIGAFYTTIECPGCEREMRRISEKGVFRCHSKRCGHRQVSIKKGTFFFGSNLSPRAILRLGHLWLSGVTFTTAMYLTGHSANTVSAFYKHFRQLVAGCLTTDDGIIGGPGIIVEIDETKLGIMCI